MSEMTREEIDALRNKYRPGMKVKLIHMEDIQAPPDGTVGEILHVDGIGTIHVKWETGSQLGLLVECDSFELLP